ncbi:MAG TPA: response regulator transcription factor [Solirubrobacteraceae bacterium]|nr:response regulator transcription factor [Solirubrobacteraceae bacterium]HUA49967.1 response regulator transcription factor [Solirubrobacteraceae bacterium]
MTAKPAPAVEIVVADDQASVRDGLVLMLDLLPDITVVAAAANGIEALALTEQHHPAVVLVDLHMPILDGIETTRRITAEHPDVAVVVLTTYADDTSVLEALHAGARGYITKNTPRSDIARAVHAAANGQSVLDPAVQATLLNAATQPSHAKRPLPAQLPDGLTKREAEVLDLIAQGHTNGEIAAALFLSGHTVKTHITRIFAKTGSQTRVQATRYAQQHRLASTDDDADQPV